MDHIGYQLTPELSREAFERDREELLNAFDPKYVEIHQEPAPEGCLGLLRVTVKARSYMVTSETDENPKPVEKQVFRIKVLDNYPSVAPKVYFDSTCRLAHVNTYRNGNQCIDRWGRYSSLLSVAEKTIRACIYDENVTKYNSMACTTLRTWQQGMAAKGLFPTVNPPDLIFRGNGESKTTPPLPPGLPRRTVRQEPKRSPLPRRIPG